MAAVLTDKQWKILELLERVAKQSTTARSMGFFEIVDIGGAIAILLAIITVFLDRPLEIS